MVKTLGSPRKSVWIADEKVLQREKQAQIDEGEIWRVFNPDKRNAQGYPVSYVLENHARGEPLLDKDDYKRAGFIAHDLWVTAYNAKNDTPRETHQIKTRENLGCPNM